ncbi:MAG: DUF1684 domain-containing protein [Candidatus Bathyarchaeia archaeon]
MTIDAIQVQVQRLREDKNKYFKLAHDSPIPHELRDSFQGLSYFPYDSNYTVTAIFKKNPTQEKIIMETSKGNPQSYSRYGDFEFELRGQKLKLQAYKSEHVHGEESLFVPFKDKTAGKETYGAGRYLDIDESKDEKYVINFNVAYNPSCVYSEDYVCPLPPRENWLDVEIKAGEKNYKHP